MAASEIEKLSLTKMHEIINSHNIIPLSRFSQQPSSSDVTIELDIGGQELVIAVTLYQGVSATDGGLDNTYIPYVIGSVYDIATGALEVRWSIWSSRSINLITTNIPFVSCSKLKTNSVSKPES